MYSVDTCTLRFYDVQFMCSVVMFTLFMTIIKKIGFLILKIVLRNSDFALCRIIFEYYFRKSAKTEQFEDNIIKTL